MSADRTIKSENGAAVVEFALILPLLLTLLFGSIEFGLLLFDKAILTNAAREGSRFGIVSASPRKTPQEIESVVTNYTAANLITFGAANDPQITVTFATQNFGDPLSVTVTYQYSFLIIDNLLPSLLGSINLTAESSMYYE